MFAALFKKGSPTHFAQVYKFGHDRISHLLEARKGRGKSFTMTYWALQCALKKVGTVANFHIDHYWLSMRLVAAKVWPSLEEALAWCKDNVRFVTTWDEIMLAYDCLVLLDEVNRLFDSQDRAKDVRVPNVVFEWIQQARRNLITLVMAAQSMDWLNTRVRQLFDILWRAKKEMHKGEIVRFWLYGADPWAKGLSADVQRGTDYKASIPFDPKLWRLYDTRERIQAIAPVSRFNTFIEVYHHQLLTGVVPRPSVPPAARPRCGACFRVLGGLSLSAAMSAPREERSAAQGRHGFPSSYVPSVAAEVRAIVTPAAEPKENPPAVTGGERGAPPQYSGGWKKRGAHGIA